MSTRAVAPRSDVIAAGAVVLRKHASGRGHEVLLVHRPRYDDWSFPKGKRDRGEHVVACAVREVEEEAGVRVVLGRPLSDQRYQLENQRMKTVHYWTARVHGDAHAHDFVPNDEVDEVRWLGWDDAAALLTHDHDRATLAEARARRRATHAVVVLRHGTALPRTRWRQAQPGADDRDRPLTPSGWRQAEQLGDVLAAWAPGQLHSSPARRCLDTVAPFAESASLGTTHVEALSEEGDADALRRHLGSLPAKKVNVVLCSHRPVLPALIDGLGVGSTQSPASPLGTSDLLVVHLRAGEVVATEVHSLG